MDPDDGLEQRDRHLDAISGWISKNGLSELTLEKAADAAGIPPAELLDFFDTKEEVVAALIARGRTSFRKFLTTLFADQNLSNTERARAVWQSYVASQDYFRLFFEAYALAFHNEQYGKFIHGIGDWVALMDGSFERQGIGRADADAYASLVIAVFRGAMLDLCATGQPGRLNAAMELWFKAGAFLENELKPKNDT